MVSLPPEKAAWGGAGAVRTSARTNNNKTNNCNPYHENANGGEQPFVVSHAYFDHLDDPVQETKNSPRIGVKEAFPFKLHTMLREADIEGFDHVVSWQPHGRAFRVNDRETFIEKIMPQFFQQTKITSFNRQLCLYGFVRLTAPGPDRGAYYHELCIRGRPDLLARLHRTRIKGTGKKAASSPQTEPDFYHMRPCPDNEVGGATTTSQVAPTSPRPMMVDNNTSQPTPSLSSVVTPSPSPRRSHSLERLPMMLPPPPPLALLPVSRKIFADDDDAFLDSDQFSFAWDDVEV